jgi:hypothetical protein
MRRTTIIALAALGALVATGAAVAHHLGGTGTSAVSATFSATTAESVKTRACSGPDGQYELLDAVFRGSATSADASLAGDVRVHVHGAYNATEQIGWATGSLRLHDARSLRFQAVNANGRLTGLVTGRVGSAGTLTASFTADLGAGGLAKAQIGGGGSIANAAVLAGRICTSPPVPKGKSVKLTVKGTIDAVSATAVTVKPADGSATQTCAVGSGSPSVSGFAPGQRVEMTCATVGNVLTVQRLKRRG